ncbi:AMP-binding protein [Stieleria varia]|uniref:Long-chain-fatty-acid--CoA ligase n=1 Tax=Stieleria varia TaxID=2528005 RepID=A0A5C6AHC2_9BACT|nr:AMP-binding protein [Stieleria varia]TWT98461.1 Long-chain-fatty-acid--CoA ligase [Stieleria varia]
MLNSNPSGGDGNARSPIHDESVHHDTAIASQMMDALRQSSPKRSSVRASGLSSYRNVPCFGVLQHAAEQLPDRVAVQYGETQFTFRDLNADSIRCAAMLQRLGVRPGDRVAILLPNVPEFAIAANGIWRAGGVVLALSPLMVSSEISAMLKSTRCRFVIALDLLTSLLDDGAKSNAKQNRTTLLVSIRKHLAAHEQIGYLLKRGYQWFSQRSNTAENTIGWFWEQMDEIDRAWQPINIDPAGDPAFILPTGGTTGQPKAVTLSHTNLVANAWQQYVWTKRSFGIEKMLAVLPFFHSYGMSATLMGGAMMGATLVMHHRFNTAQVIRLIETHQPSVMHAVPAMLVAMNAHLASHPTRLDSLRWVISGGASLDPATAIEFGKHSNALIVEGFGLSEASPVTHVGHLFRPARYGVIGLPLPHTKCRIVDPNDLSIDMPVGAVGELAIKGPQVMLGYWGDATATREAIQDGWLYTGDLAVRHPDGYYSIVGRKKDLIITSGFNVYPKEVEAKLKDFAGVRDAAVIGEKDPQRGEIVSAYVVMEPGEEMDEAALRAHCEKSLSKHKRPRKYTACSNDLPRNFLGKVIRRKLREASESAESSVAAPGGSQDE